MARASVELVSPYEMRPQFRPLHRRRSRWAICVSHRRAGKTVACINELIIGATMCRRHEPQFAYIAPQKNQAKDVAWKYLKSFTRFSPGRRVSETELWVELPGGAQIRIRGADDPTGCAATTSTGSCSTNMATWTRRRGPR